MKQPDMLCRMKAEVFKALGHPIRLAIVEALRDGERCVCEIAEEVASERSNVSRHLALLVSAGVLSSRKDGLMVFYNLRTPCILNFFTCVENVLREQLEQKAELLGQLTGAE